jgi:hypothetical protein
MKRHNSHLLIQIGIFERHNLIAAGTPLRRLMQPRAESDGEGTGRWSKPAHKLRIHGRSQCGQSLPVVPQPIDSGTALSCGLHDGKWRAFNPTSGGRNLGFWHTPRMSAVLAARTRKESYNCRQISHFQMAILGQRNVYCLQIPLSPKRI